MSKSVKSQFSDDSLSSLFDIASIRKSIKKNNWVKYILLFFFIFGLISIFLTIFLNLNNQEEELE